MPPWSHWNASRAETPYTVGIEEELMLLRPDDWSMAQCSEEVLEALPADLRAHVTTETHSSALELRTGVHEAVRHAVEDLGRLRARLSEVLDGLELTAAVAGTHPSAVWHDMAVTSRDRHQAVYGSMRSLARREPTFALHVHVGLPTGEAGIAVHNRMRAHLPVLLALSASSPFWQGRDTGLASARTPLFQAFPRVGIPRAFGSYGEYVQAVDLLLACEAFPDPTHLWWDVRPQPKLGTVEARIMDAQSTLEETTALAAFVQCLVRLETIDGYAPPALVHAPEVLDENRFLAARDGVAAKLVDPAARGSVSVADAVARLLDACAPHAVELDCAAELDSVRTLLADPGATRQRRVAEHHGLDGLVAVLSADFTSRSDRSERDVSAPR